MFESVCVCTCVLPSDGDFGEDSQLGDAGDSRTGVAELVRAEKRIRGQLKSRHEVLLLQCFKPPLGGAAASHMTNRHKEHYFLTFYRQNN